MTELVCTQDSEDCQAVGEPEEQRAGVQEDGNRKEGLLQ